MTVIDEVLFVVGLLAGLASLASLLIAALAVFVLLRQRGLDREEAAAERRDDEWLARCGVAPLSSGVGERTLVPRRRGPGESGESA